MVFIPSAAMSRMSSGEGQPDRGRVPYPPAPNADADTAPAGSRRRSPEGRPPRWPGRHPRSGEDRVVQRSAYCSRSIRAPLTICHKLYPKRNTVEIVASPSLMLPWVCFAPKQHGGCDSHASKTKFVADRWRWPGFGSVGGTGTSYPPRAHSASPRRHLPGQLPQVYVDS